MIDSPSLELREHSQSVLKECLLLPTFSHHSVEHRCNTSLETTLASYPLEYFVPWYKHPHMMNHANDSDEVG